MSNKILLYGVPGTGKSTIARILAEHVSCKYMELNTLRTPAQKQASVLDEPFLFEYSTTAWKKFGELNKANAIKGFLSVREAMLPYVTRELSKYESFVAEAVYVTPLVNEGKAFLIALQDKKQHYNQFFIHRKPSALADEQFKAARYIQGYLIQEATTNGTDIVFNDGDVEEAARQIKNSLI